MEGERDSEAMTVPKYVRRKIRAMGFGIHAIDDVPRQREYAVMRDTLATVKKMRSEGATRDEIREALGEWANSRTGRWSTRRRRRMPTK